MQKIKILLNFFFRKGFIENLKKFLKSLQKSLGDIKICQLIFPVEFALSQQ